MFLGEKKSVTKLLDVMDSKKFAVVDDHIVYQNGFFFFVCVSHRGFLDDWIECGHIDFLIELRGGEETKIISSLYLLD